MLKYIISRFWHTKHKLCMHIHENTDTLADMALYNIITNRK